MSDEENEVIPVGGKPIPDPYLVGRSDQAWEKESSDVRISLVQEWAQGRLERVLQLGSLGLDPETDDEFNDLIDELYNGIRDRLTRQDLIRAMLLHLGMKLSADLEGVALKMKRDLRALDHEDSFDRFFRS